MSRAELARIVGRARSTITEACQGPLKAACIGHLIDLAHPVLAAYARDVWRRQLPPSTSAKTPKRVELRVVERAATAAELADLAGVDLAQVAHDMQHELRDAVIPSGHVSAGEFAARAQVPTDAVLAAARSALRPAVVASGRIDLGHDVALKFMAARPFERDRRTNEPVVPEIDGVSFLAPACVGENVDLEHPVALCFLARCCYRPSQLMA